MEEPCFKGNETKWRMKRHSYVPRSFLNPDAAVFRSTALPIRPWRRPLDICYIGLTLGYVRGGLIPLLQLVVCCLYDLEAINLNCSIVSSVSKRLRTDDRISRESCYSAIGWLIQSVYYRFGRIGLAHYVLRSYRRHDGTIVNFQTTLWKLKLLFKMNKVLSYRYAETSEVRY